MEARTVLAQIVFWRSKLPEVDVFALFLEERLDSEDLDFLGYVLEGALEVHACVDAPCVPLPLLALTTCLLPSD